MATPAPSKYALKTLHEEIALFDRKLAHLEKFETFTSERERLAAQAKMSVKRGQLVRAAQAMTEAGIEFEPKDVPHSLQPALEVVETEALDEPAAAPTPASSRVATMPPPTASILDFRNSIAEYKKRRRLTA